MKSLVNGIILSILMGIQAAIFFFIVPIEDNLQAAIIVYFVIFIISLIETYYISYKYLDL